MNAVPRGGETQKPHLLLLEHNSPCRVLSRALPACIYGVKFRPAADHHETCTFLSSHGKTLVFDDNHFHSIHCLKVTSKFKHVPNGSEVIDNE
jgi:hypothetical protein